MSELAVVLVVMAAVAGVLILLFWVLPWLIDLGGDPDESVRASEIIRRVEDEQRCRGRMVGQDCGKLNCACPAPVHSSTSSTPASSRRTR